jgi:hypothetical protein
MSKITRVSKTFHTLIESSPSMWSFLSSFHSEKLRKTALAKSMNAPLNITGTNRNRPAFRKFLESLSAQGHRFLSVDLFVDSVDGIDHLPQSPAPLLERLVLRSNAYKDPKIFDISNTVPKLLDVFGGVAPRLRDVLVEGVSLRMDATTCGKVPL